MSRFTTLQFDELKLKRTKPCDQHTEKRREQSVPRTFVRPSIVATLVQKKEKKKKKKKHTERSFALKNPNYVAGTVFLSPLLFPFLFANCW